MAEMMKSISDVADSKQQHHFHVLVVDDSVIDRKLLERLLKGSSYKVTSVDSGDEALQYLGLLDQDDLKSTHSSSSPYPQQHPSEQLEGSCWKGIPVVVMLSENVPSRINMCLEEGAEEFLLKPLQISHLKKLQPYLLKTLEQSASCDRHLVLNWCSIGGPWTASRMAHQVLLPKA